MSEHHILVIDDDERLRVLLRRFLEESGFRVTDAGNASEARKILRGIAFDLLVVDIMMPGETGLEFLADIRKDNAVPALFLTAMSDTENRIEGLEAGADDYMSKHSNRANLCCGSNVFSSAIAAMTILTCKSILAPFCLIPIPAFYQNQATGCISQRQSSSF